MGVIVQIARQIPRVWKEVAYLTKLFETHKIVDLIIARVYEDKTDKALIIFTRYMKRQGTRQRLAVALEEVKLVSPSQNVLSGYFIDTGEEE